MVAGPRDESWRCAGRFLDLAHLADYATTGDNSPGNIVPLCHFPCHHDIPMFDNRAGALAWVNAGRMAPGWWQVCTDAAGLAGNLTGRRQLRDLHRWAQGVMLEGLLPAPDEPRVVPGLRRPDRAASV